MKAEFRNILKQEKIEIDGIEYVRFDLATGILDEVESDMVRIVSDLEELTLKFY